VSRDLGWPEVQPTLAGTGIVVRPWRSGDSSAVFEACQDAAIQRFTRVPVPYLQTHADEFVGTMAATVWADVVGASFAVVDGAADDLLGAIGVVGLDVESRRGEVGYWMVPAARGRGVATQALSLLAAWLLDQGGLRCVFVEIETDNQVSRRVAERAGFVPTDIPPRLEEHRGEDRLFHTLIREAKSPQACWRD
jgi:RimJ/RimL family protein N-acetyltransferase